MVIRLIISNNGNFFFRVVDDISKGLMRVVILSIRLIFVMLEFSVLLIVVFGLLLIDVIVEIIIFGVEEFMVIIVRLIIMGEMLMFLVRVEVL